MTRGMESEKPATSTVRIIVRQWAQDGVGIVIAILFFIIVGIMVIIATAQSAKPWDTFIAALGVISQTFFAFVVWRLTISQNAFTKRMTERQQEIDKYPHRKEAAQKLEKLEPIINRQPNISDDEIEAFRLSHIEINKLFSPEAEELSFELYQTMENARRFMVKAQPTIDCGGSITIPAGAEETGAVHKLLDHASDILTDLQNLMAEEMRIR